MLLNTMNFFRFSYNDDPETNELPQAYIRERCLFDHMPIIVPGEDLAFYINTQYGVNYAKTLRIEFVKNGVVEATSTDLSYDIISATNYNIYADLVIPVLPDGIYTMRMLTNDNVVRLTSNKLLCLNSGYENVSSYLSFTNKINLYNVRYANLINFSQKMRLRITDVTGGDYEFNQEAYLSVSTGLRRDLTAINQRYYTFEAYYFDRYAFEALACFLGHQTRIINNKTYSSKEGVSHDAILTTNKTKGTFQLYDQSFATVNRCSGSVSSS